MNAKIQDIYPVTSMQEGMLFHSLYAPESGVYVEQVSCRLTGRLNVRAFEEAWEHVIDRHCVLRSSFVWDGIKEPVQVIHQSLKVGIERFDWRQKSSEAQQEQMRERLEQERRNGFKLDQAPLMKLSLFQTGDEEYQFVWLHHHLLIDGWSLSIVLNEVFGSYLAFERGHAPKLPEPARYKDYVQWRKRQDVKKAEQFWKNHLQGFVASATLGLEQSAYPAAERESASFSRESCCRVSEEETRELRNWAKQHQLTLNTIVQGAWAILLSRYSGSGDVVFGGTVSGRPVQVPGMDRLIGLFINTLPVRVRFAEEKSVLSWLREIQETQAEVRDYEYTPLARVQGWSDAGNAQPLFDTIVVFENYPVSHSLEQMRKDAGLQITDITRAEQTNYGIVLAATLESGHLKLQIGFDSSRYTEKIIDGRLREVANLLRRIPKAADGPLGSLSLLGDSARDKLLHDWNNTCIRYPGRKYAHQLFADQAERTPETVALQIGKDKLSYRDLNYKANQLANYLRELGVSRGTLVAVLAERSLEMVIALIGILKAGAAYVPLDCSYPQERLNLMLEDAQPQVLLTQEKLRKRLPDLGATVVCLDGDWPDIANKSAQTPEVRISFEDLAYVIFTSGSTGKPRGAMNTHGALRNHLLWRQSIFPLGASDKILKKISISFDPSVWEIWGPLVAGARLILAAGPMEDPHYVVGELLKHEITIFQSPPPMIQMLLDVPEFSKCSSLKTVICGGEALTLQLQNRFFSGINSELHNLYGPTEAAVDATYWRCRRESDESIIPIGQPVANAQVYILGAGMEPAPIGAAGELHIGGVGLARGYLNSPELTAEKFVANPFSQTGGERLYKTGDLARWRADGVLEFLGRLDHQVKVRGFRIELGEIEAVLRRHEHVEQVVVVADQDRSGSNRLLAYVVLNQTIDSPVDRSGLRRYLKTKLPDYMVPAVIMRVEALPLTPNGKIDRDRLPEPDLSLVDTAFEGPRTPTEEMLAAIWTDILGNDHIGIHDNFFELGGHSLLAMQMASRIRKSWGTELLLRQLFEEPTISAIGKIIDESQRREQRRDVPRVMRVPRENNLPLSFAQERLWVLEQWHPGNSIAVTVGFEGPLDISALHHSLNALVRRHEALRTVFPTIEGRPIQAVQSIDGLPLPQEDLEQLTTDEQQVRVKELLQANEHMRFNLDHAPLLRALLVRLNQHSHILQVTMHHIISDGWSMGVLVKELGILYRACRKGEDSPLPELKVQYADYAVWQRESMKGEVLQQQLQYWVKQLKGLPQLELPNDRGRRLVEQSTAGIVTRELSGEISRRLKKLAREENATLFMVLLAVWEVLLWRYTGQQEMAVGTPVANRNREEIEGVVGFFVNTLVMRGQVEAEESIRELIKKVKETALAAYAHQDLPFDRIVDELHPERNIEQTPLFQVMLVLQNAALPEIDLEGVKIATVESVGQAVPCDLMLEVQEREGRELRVGLHYRRELYEKETVERMLSHLHELLAGVVRGTEQRVMELPLLSRQEEKQLLEEWNHTQKPVQRDECIQQLFEEQVARTPNAVAVRYKGNEWTYKELNEKANQLAHYLRGRGITTEIPVGICLERSIDMIVSIIAVLKAGGAYVPLDPNYPAERLEYSLEDSRAPVLLVQKKLAELLPSYPGKIVDPEAQWNEINLESRENPVAATLPENLAYVIYTSGSTGKPKGVAIRHSSAVVMLRWAHLVFSPSELAEVLASTSICFDLSVFEIFAPLTCGGAVSVAANALELPTMAEARLLTLVNTVPSAMRELVRSRAIPESVRIVNLAGEALPADLVRDVYAARKVEKVFNLYGPTEDTTYSTYAYVDRNAVTVPIGNPIANTQAYVLDQWMQPVAVGIVGNLYLAGDGLARGYLNAPDRTAERFIANSFSSKPGERMYETGDLARWSPDGTLEYLGRRDNQIKLRGFRIELGEIESRLAQHPMVAEAVVIAREGARGEKRLVAYYTLAGDWSVGDRNAGIKLLRDHLTICLPEYMVPAAYVRLDSLPLNPNGKVDRKALPAPEEEDVCLTHEYEAPAGEIETLLAKIWAELLQVERVGVHDNFFELGGDSILSIQAVSRANQAGVALTARQILEQQTIAGLARVAQRAGTVTAEQGVVTGLVPLTPIQQWFFERDWPRRNHFNQAVLLKPLERLELDVVRRVVTKILQQHDALRMRFRQEDGIWRQENSAQQDVASVVDWVDLTEVEIEQQSAAVAQEAEKWQLSLNLEHGPLLRFVLMQLRDSQRLLVIVHHLVVDAVSWRVLLEDFENTYRQLSAGHEIQLGHKTTSFKDWAERLQEYSASPNIQNEIHYWQDVLGEPTSRAIGHGVGSNAAISVALDQEFTRILTNQMQTASHASILEVLLAAVGRALCSSNSCNSVLIDLEGHGREDVIPDVDISRTVGWFTALFPVRLQFDEEANCAADLQRVKEKLREIPNHGLGFGLLRHMGQPETAQQLKSLARSKVCFNYLGHLDKVLAGSHGFVMAEESPGTLIDPDSDRDYELIINSEIRAGKLNLHWSYRSDLHSTETIRELAQEALEQLRSLIATSQSAETSCIASDFPLAHLRQDDLDNLLADLK